VTLPERAPPPKFPLRAADFFARGLSQGPAVGVALAQAENAWIDAGFPLDAATLDSIAAAAMRVALQSVR